MSPRRQRGEGPVCDARQGRAWGRGCCTLALLMCWLPALALSQQKETLVLDLDAVMTQAVSNSPELRAYELDFKSATAAARGESAYWEPAFVASSQYENNRRENTAEESLSLLTPIFEERNQKHSAGIEGRLFSGAKYRVGYDYKDLQNNIAELAFRQRTPFEDEYVSFAGVSLTQPLLKNFGPSVTRSRMIQAELQQEMARQDLRRHTMLTIARAKAAYSAVWEAQEIVGLRDASLGRARQLVADNEKRLKEGKMAEIEITQAKVGVAYRERLWLEAQENFSESVRDLMNVINGKIPDADIRVKDLPAEDGAAAPGLPERVRLAGQYHPDILVARKKVEIGELFLTVQKNQRRPQLDLTGSYGLNGLGNSFGTSWDDVKGEDFKNWTIGLVFRCPLGGDMGEAAKLEQARFNAEKTVLGRKSVELQVGNALQTTLKKVSLFKAIIAALDDEVRGNTLALDNEKMLLENGKSTSRKLLELEQDVADAQIEKTKASVNYFREKVRLDLADGALLLRHGLESPPPDEGTTPAPRQGAGHGKTIAPDPQAGKEASL